MDAKWCSANQSTEWIFLLRSAS